MGFYSILQATGRLKAFAIWSSAKEAFAIGSGDEEALAVGSGICINMIALIDMNRGGCGLGESGGEKKNGENRES